MNGSRSKHGSPRRVRHTRPLFAGLAMLAVGLAWAAPTEPAAAEAMEQADVDVAAYVPLALAASRPLVPPRATRVPPPTEAPPTEPPPTVVPAPTATKPATEPTCGAGDFLDVAPHPENDEYPDPELEARCTGELLVIESNGIPSFEFTAMTPNDLRAQDYTWEIPLDAAPLDEPEDIPLLGPIAIAVDGLPIYGPNEAPQHGTADPYLDEILDFCNGHTAQRGDYHYHARNGCLFEDIDGNPTLVVAYAFDGYPIMAPYVCDDPDCTTTRKLESSWVRSSDERNAWDAHEYVEGTGDLDRCNGRVDADGEYRYYATDTFPYFLGCYRGAPRANGAGGGGGPGPPRP